MSQFHKRGLAAAAITAASVASSLLSGSAAHATTYGDPSPNSPVTVTTGNTVNTFGTAAKITLPPGSHDVSWAGQGGRLAFIGGDNGVYTADYDGSHIIQVAKPSGTPRSHTVWDAENYWVLWTEGGGVFRALGNGNTDGSPEPFVFDGDNTGGHQLGWADVAADDAQTTVFQTTTASGTGIAVESWSNGSQVYTQVIDEAANGPTTPTISPDGNTIVFVGLDADNHKQLYKVTRSGSTWAKSTPVQVTFDAADHTTPIFEVDGKTVAYTGADGTYTVDITKATATANTSFQRISSLTGGLAVRTDSKGRVKRFAGGDRYDTAVQASQDMWANGGAQSVTLSRADLFADALGGAGLAAHKNGPLLLTDTGSLTAETKAEILRVLPKGKTVYLLGGIKAISPQVEAQLQALGYNTDRVYGNTRYDTAVAIANNITTDPSQILVATGDNFPDALSAGAVAAAQNGTVVLLTDNTAMPSATGDYLNQRQLWDGVDGDPGAVVWTVGGQATQAMGSGFPWSQNFESLGLVGNTRYETSHLVAQTFFGAEGGIGVATGLNWPDALAGSAFMGRIYGPLLLVDPNVGLDDTLDPDKGIVVGEDGMIDANRGSNNRAFVFGGKLAVPAFIDGQLGNDVRTAEGLSTPENPDAAFTHLAETHAAPAHTAAAPAAAAHAPAAEVQKLKKG
jgi:putative cell wall-binding protein